LNESLTINFDGISDSVSTSLPKIGLQSGDVVQTNKDLERELAEQEQSSTDNEEESIQNEIGIGVARKKHNKSGKKNGDSSGLTLAALLAKRPPEIPFHNIGYRMSTMAEPCIKLFTWTSLSSFKARQASATIHQDLTSTTSVLPNLPSPQKPSTPAASNPSLLPPPPPSPIPLLLSANTLGDGVMRGGRSGLRNRQRINA